VGYLWKQVVWNHGDGGSGLLQAVFYVAVTAKLLQAEGLRALAGYGPMIGRVLSAFSGGQGF
jgi:hypothetical protein